MHLTIFVLFLTFFNAYSTEVKVHLTSTSPAIYNSILTFKATISPPLNETRTFIFTFPYYESKVIGVDQVVLNRTYHKNHVGTHHVKVEVFDFWSKIASDTLTYEITESIPGSIFYYQNSTLNHTKGNFVSTKTPVAIKQLIHDPNNFFGASQMIVTWTVDDKIIGDTKMFNYSFPAAGEHTITSTILVFSKFSLTPFSGYFEKTLISMDPIDNITISGKKYLQKSEILDLTVNCSGGGSYYEYCWKAVNNTNETEEHFVCTDTTISSSCNFHISYYFGKPGYHLIKMYIQNNIDIKYLDVAITVYSVEPTTGLYQIILPMIAVLLAVVIVVASLIAYKRRKPRIKVEVADFDFQERLVVDNENTFFERLSYNLRHLLTCGGLLNQLFRRPQEGIVPTSPSESSSN